MTQERRDEPHRERPGERERELPGRSGERQPGEPERPEVERGSREREGGEERRAK